MDKFDREGLRASLKSGNIPVSDDEIRQLDGVRTRKIARTQDLKGAVGEIGSG
jgi:hypothetical protein